MPHSHEQSLENTIKEITQYEQEHGEDLTLLFMKSSLFYQVGEYALAKKALLKALNDFPEQPDIYLNLAAIAEKQHDLSLRTVYDALAARAYQVNDFFEEEASLDCLYEQKSETEQLLYQTVKNQVPHTFIFTPMAGFSKVKQRFQNLCIALAQLGQQVIYIEPEREISVSVPISQEEALEYVVNHGRKEEGVLIFSPIMVPSLGIRTYHRFLELLAAGKENPVFVSSSCWIEPIAKKMKRHGMIVYDCVDDHSDYENAYWSSEFTDRQFRRLEKNADAILTTASSLFLQKSRDWKKPVFLSRNAVSASEIAAGLPAEIPEDIAAIPIPRIGYVGVIYQRFNRDLFYEVVKNNPDKSFIIVGEILENWITRKYPNIYFLGPKDHSLLHLYYKAMDVCWIPYLDDAKMSVACDPVKLYEHIGCNVPTITTFMPDTAIDKPLVYHANTAKEVQADLEEILRERPSLSMEELEFFLLENSWHMRASLLIRLVERRITAMDSVEYVKSHLTQQLELLKEYHPNFRILYALCCENQDSPQYCSQVEHAHKDLPSPFISEEYLRSKGYRKLFGHTFIDIFHPPAMLPKDTYVEIMWLNTFWCNNECTYCHMSHDRRMGHAFDTASPQEWAECINQIQVPFILNISGGETFLDHKNFTEFYNLVIDNPRLIRIRIDTNNTVPAKFLQQMKIDRTSLMTSHHPSRHTPQETLASVKSYRDLGFDISMVNYVCNGKQMEEYKKLRPLFEQEGFPFAASLYFGPDACNDNQTLTAYMEVLDKTDIGFKTCFQTKGLPCRAASHLLMLSPQGKLTNCWQEEWDIFQKTAYISLSPRLCPTHSCDCITKYSLLDVAKRDMRNSLDHYIQTYAHPKQTKVLLIVGFFGYGNFGDELLLETLLTKLKKQPNLLPVVLSFGPPEQVAARHQVLAVSLFDEKRIGMLTCLCDGLILGPGGLLEDYLQLDPKEFSSHRGIYSYLYPVILAQLNGKPITGIGLGAGPLTKEETKRALYMALHSANILQMRDEYSLETMNKCSLKQSILSADLAFSYKYEGIKRSANSKAIGINLRPHILTDMERLLPEIIEFIKVFAEEEHQIRLIILQKSEEDLLIKTLTSKFAALYPELAGHLEVVCPNTVKEAIDEIASLPIMAAMRLHANIVSANLGVPTLFLSYDPKVSQAAKRLNQEKFVIDPNRATSRLLYTKAKHLLDKRQELSEQLLLECRKLKKLSDQALDQLNNWIGELS